MKYGRKYGCVYDRSLACVHLIRGRQACVTFSECPNPDPGTVAFDWEFCRLIPKDVVSKMMDSVTKEEPYLSC